jgi:glycosyltransferase involved in cell wall biosynthesis
MTNKKALIFSFAYYPYVGGAEVAVKEITDRLKDFTFDLVTFDLGGQPKDEMIGNVRVHRIFSFSKYLYPIRSFFTGLRLHRKNRYDVVWAMMANTGFAALFLKLLFPQIKFVLTIQEGDPIPQIKKRVWFVYPLFKMVFKYADTVTAISNYLADFAKEMGTKSVEVIPNGVDLNRFKPKNEKLILNIADKIVLVTTSRLVKKNAVDDIIKSLKYLPENIIFRSIGSGEDEAYLRGLVAELQLENRVELLPHTEHTAMSEILRNSDIFIRPSLSEGLGISFLEAMAIGLPIIATSVGGIPDFLKDGETGLFCEVRNPKSIAKNVIRLIEDHDLYLKISNNSKKLIAESYDWEMISGRFRKIFTDRSN